MNTRLSHALLLAALALALAGCGGKQAEAPAATGGILEEGDVTRGAVEDTLPEAQAVDVAAEMARLRDESAPLAVRIADEGFGIRLDYSNESIAQVEVVLGHIHDEYRRTGNSEGLEGVALEFGAYIVAVIERNEGPGRWERDSPQMGKGTLPYYWRDRVLFPVIWCSKRIQDGPSENVAKKFDEIVMSQVRP